MTGRRTRRSTSRKSGGDAPIENQEEPPSKKSETSQDGGAAPPRRSTRARRQVPPSSRSTSPTAAAPAARTASQRKRRRSFQSNRDNENDTAEDNSEDGDQNNKASSASEPQETSDSVSVSDRRPNKVAKGSTSDEEDDDDDDEEEEDEVQDSGVGSAEESNIPSAGSREGDGGDDNKDPRDNSRSQRESPSGTRNRPRHAKQEASATDITADEGINDPEAESCSPSSTGNALMTLMDAIYIKEHDSVKSKAPSSAVDEEHADNEQVQVTAGISSAANCDDFEPRPPNSALDSMESNGDADGQLHENDPHQSSSIREDASTGTQGGSHDLKMDLRTTPEKSSEQDHEEKPSDRISSSDKEDCDDNDGEDKGTESSTLEDTCLDKGSAPATLDRDEKVTTTVESDQDSGVKGLTEQPETVSESGKEPQSDKSSNENEQHSNQDGSKQDEDSNISGEPVARQADDCTVTYDKSDTVDSDTAGMKSEAEELTSGPIDSDAGPLLLDTDHFGIPVEARHQFSRDVPVNAANKASEPSNASEVKTTGDGAMPVNAANKASEPSKASEVKTTGDVAMPVNAENKASEPSNASEVKSTGDGASDQMTEKEFSDEPLKNPLTQIESGLKVKPTGDNPEIGQSDVSKLKATDPVDDKSPAEESTASTTVEEPREKDGNSTPPKAPPNPPHTVTIHHGPTFDQIKARLYFIGCNAHRGSGAERIFANYWRSLTLYLSCQLNAANAEKCQEAFAAFLTTRKLRRLHNILIFSLLQQTLQPSQTNKPIPIPRHLQTRGAKANSLPPVGFSKTPEIVHIARMKERHRSLQVIEPVNEGTHRYAPLQVDEAAHHELSMLRNVDYPNSSSLPGALVVDPFARDLVQREGMRTNEITVWLLTVAVHEYVKSLLTSVITAKDSIDDQQTSPETTTSASNSSTENKIIGQAADYLPFTLPPNERKRVTVVDMGCLMAGHPSRKSDAYNGRVSRTASERCIHSMFDCSPFSQGEDFEEVRRFISSEILSVALSKRRRVEKVPIASIATAVPAVAEAMTSENRNEPEAKDSKDDSRIRSPVVGLGRGAKDLAALKARAAAAAKTSGTEDQMADGSTDRDSAETPSTANTPIRGNRSTQVLRHDPADAAAAVELVAIPGTSTTASKTIENVATKSNTLDVPPKANIVEATEPHPTSEAPQKPISAVLELKVQEEENQARNENNLEDAPTKKLEDAPTKKLEDAPTKKLEDAPTKELEDAPTNKLEDASIKKLEEAPLQAEGVGTEEQKDSETKLEASGTENLDDSATNASEDSASKKAEDLVTKPVEPVVSQKGRRGKGFGIKNLAAMRARTLTKEEAGFGDNWTTENSNQTPHGSPKSESLEGQYATGAASSVMTPIKTSNQDDERASQQPNIQTLAKVNESNPRTLPPGTTRRGKVIEERPLPIIRTSLEESPLPTVETFVPGQHENDEEMTTAAAGDSSHEKSLQHAPTQQKGYESSQAGDDLAGSDAQTASAAQATGDEIVAPGQKESKRNAKILLQVPIEVAESAEGSEQTEVLPLLP